MSFNIYGFDEEKTPEYNELLDKFEEMPQTLDLYNTTCQSPKSLKLSIHKPHTGSSKYIKKKFGTRKQKSNQYTSEEQNFIINQIGSEGFIHHFIQQNTNQLLLQQRDLNKIIKRMKQLNLH